MKFETVLFAAAFLILALISFPKGDQEDTAQAQDPAAVETTDTIAQN